MDKETWFNLAVSILLGELKACVKNPERKAKLKPAMLKIAATIFALWNDDGNFAEVVEARSQYESAKFKRL